MTLLQYLRSRQGEASWVGDLAGDVLHDRAHAGLAANMRIMGRWRDKGHPAQPLRPGSGPAGHVGKPRCRARGGQNDWKCEERDRGV